MTSESIELTSDQKPSQSVCSDPPRVRLRLGSLRVDNIDESALIQSILTAAFHSSETKLVTPINAQLCVLAEKDERFRECILRAEYVCADGVSIAVACQLIRGTKVARIPGVDLVSNVCSAGAPLGLRVFFMGGLPGSADETARIFKEKYPGLRVVGVSCPPRGFERDPETLRVELDRVVEARPQIVFVGLGAPKQEFLMHDHIRSLKIPVAFAVGGSFEMIAGKVRRAPVWVRNIGMEWLFRLSQEPRRLWRRYIIGNAEFILVLVKHCILPKSEHQR